MAKIKQKTKMHGSIIHRNVFGTNLYCKLRKKNYNITDEKKESEIISQRSV